LRIFAHQGRHVAPIGVKVGLEEGDPKVPLLQAKFHSIGATVRVYGPKKTKFLLRFDQNVEFKRPAGAYPLRDFHKFAEFVSCYRIRQLLKYRWICSMGYGVMGVLS